MKEFAFEVGLIARVRVRAADEASAGSWVGAPSERASLSRPVTRAQGAETRPAFGQRPVPPPCGLPLLFVFLNGALRLHAAHRAYVANIHETVCDGCAFLGVHRPITAGTSNDRKFAQVAYHTLGCPPGCSGDPPQQTRSRSLRLNEVRREFLI
jgi:hypothetical protein